ncbi:disease resistance protein RPV1-like [Arachis stenosperma]|uniref:disease resistance protein RPV1-like n=1 Tax=Arachis stenosperma TaxID=217475 RepID=UPI0025ABBEA2|nr:disease resistance protein RPV1-like [Arachis stenosperma]
MCNLCSRLSLFITAMATTATNNTDENYDVFLSFGGDTRYNFTSHLLGAIKRQHVNTYVDFNLGRGSEISSALVSAIRKAPIAVIVLTDHTASSKWCLDEATEIMECKRTRNQIVLPIFYHLDPSDVRNQSGCYGVAFEEHMKQKDCIEKVPTWREALKQMANLSGWHCVANMNEYELVENIAEDVRKIVHSNCLNVNRAKDEFERQKDMLRQLYKKNQITSDQTLHVWEMAKIVNLTKDIGKASKLSEEIKKVIEEGKTSRKVMLVQNK